ncbi:MAG: sigma-70 family RNA polymerase sigma factor [Candidatus Obscuribacterales bacterium]|jgi:RNA polymerase sigma-70 factor (ECF subfamily)
MNSLSILKNSAPVLKVVEPAKKYSDMTDAELVIACQANDQLAMNQLLARHERTATAMFYRLAPDWRDNSDLVQEAMIRMWRSVPKLKNPYAFKTWLNQIVNNLFYDELRKRPRDTQFVSLDERLTSDTGSDMGTRELAATAPQPEDRLLTNELSDVLEKAMSNMSPRFRKVAMLRDVEGYSYEQIAQITDTELGTVKSRIARARMKMQRTINTYLQDAA